MKELTVLRIEKTWMTEQNKGKDIEKNENSDVEKGETIKKKKMKIKDEN